jgi:hypothetical protein
MLTLTYLNSLDPITKQKEILSEFIKCKRDPVYTIQTYFTVLDASKGQRVPFTLYPHQIRAVNDYENYSLNITMKTRQMGFTAISAAYVAFYMCTKQNQVINALAQEKKTSRKFLRQVRETLDNARKTAPWLVADYVFNNNGKDSFTLKTGCIITAEANKPDACRGDTINLLIIDEVAAITHMDEIWASAGLTLTKSRGKCIAISTPKGNSGWYFEQYSNAAENGWNIIEAHWSEHPDYRLGMYQFIKDSNHLEGGYVKFFNEEWPDVTDPIQLMKYHTKPTYPYVLDGKLRSPWYDYESKRLGLQKTRCELDCSFSGSGGEVLDGEVIRALRLNARLILPIDITTVGFELTGMWRSLKIYKEYDENCGYVLSADVATGDGSDFSTIVVINITTKEIVCTYKEKVDPIMFARIIKQVAIYFGKCLVMVEYQGPGLAVLLELKNNLHYSKLYHSTLKKQEPTKVQKRKIGFWQGGSTRELGGAKLEETLNTNELRVYSEEFIFELDTWIWDTDGKRRHASGKNDDLIMAATNALFYIYYVLPRRDINASMMQSTFSRVINGGADVQIQDWRDLLLDRKEDIKVQQQNGNNNF